MLQKQTSKKMAFIKAVLIFTIFTICIIVFSNGLIAQKINSKIDERQVPSTLQGASDADLQEYQKITNKYFERYNNRKYNIENWAMPVEDKVSVDDQKRLETIYFTMTKEQQENQNIFFRKYPKPVPKNFPTEKQISEWKNTAKYGLWIDGKHQKNNEVLNNFTNTDFSHFFISKLYKNASATGLNKGKQYQVGLMTINDFSKYYKDAMDKIDTYRIWYKFKKIKK